jgi:hypothetical protein
MASFVLCAGSRPAERGVRIVLTGSRLNVEWNKVDSKGRICPYGIPGLHGDLGMTTF